MSVTLPSFSIFMLHAQSTVVCTTYVLLSKYAAQVLVSVLHRDHHHTNTNVHTAVIRQHIVCLKCNQYGWRVCQYACVVRMCAQR